MYKQTPLNARLDRFKHQMEKHREAMETLVDQYVAHLGDVQADSQHLVLIHALGELDAAISGTWNVDLIASEAELAQQYTQFCRLSELPHDSADELLTRTLAPEQQSWLETFVRNWERAVRQG